MDDPYVGDGEEGEAGILQFCDAMEWIEQPDKNHRPRCPPEKGFGDGECAYMGAVVYGRGRIFPGDLFGLRWDLS
ncbi:MAG: hypothetical protein CL912_08965 [Deltaproteobacteria bacterium]|nr:hypothetical protein [Deltaproteobacteria bacterium]